MRRPEAHRRRVPRLRDKRHRRRRPQGTQASRQPATRVNLRPAIQPRRRRAMPRPDRTRPTRTRPAAPRSLLRIRITRIIRTRTQIIRMRTRTTQTPVRTPAEFRLSQPRLQIRALRPMVARRIQARQIPVPRILAAAVRLLAQVAVKTGFLTPPIADPILGSAFFLRTALGY